MVWGTDGNSIVIFRNLHPNNRLVFSSLRGENKIQWRWSPGTGPSSPWRSYRTAWALPGPLVPGGSLELRPDVVASEDGHHGDDQGMTGTLEESWHPWEVS
jgi:hypothetical protein